jgi:hypothetical protein
MASGSAGTTRVDGRLAAAFVTIVAAEVAASGERFRNEPAGRRRFGDHPTRPLHPGSADRARLSGPHAVQCFPRIVLVEVLLVVFLGVDERDRVDESPS